MEIMSNSISNEKKLIGTPNKININSTNYISIGEFQKRNSEFYEVIYNNNGKEIFLGRFVKEYEKLNVSYNNGKILIFMENRLKNNIFAITKVLALYEILDDTFYSVSEEEALKIFDPNLNSQFLKHKNNLIAREDLEKRQKLK